MLSDRRYRYNSGYLPARQLAAACAYPFLVWSVSMPLSAAHRAALKQLYTALADRVLTLRAQTALTP